MAADRTKAGIEAYGVIAVAQHVERGSRDSELEKKFRELKSMALKLHFGAIQWHGIEAS